MAKMKYKRNLCCGADCNKPIPFEDVYCDKCRKYYLAGIPPQEKNMKKNNWEKEFDKSFGYLEDVCISNTGARYGYTSINPIEEIKDFINQLLQELIDTLDTNPNPDGSESPNLQHWIERKKSELRDKYL